MKLRKKRLYRHFLVSCICIAVVPMTLLMGLIYQTTLNEYQNNAQAIFRRAMEQSANYIDTIVQEMQSMVTIFTTNQQVAGMLDGATSNPDELIAVMSNYLANAQENSRIKTQMIFYRMGDTHIYTSSGLLDYQVFQQQMANAADLDRSSFFSRLNKTTTLTLWPMVSKHSQQSSGLMAVALPVFQADAGRQGTFVCLVDMEQIMNIVTEYLGVEPVCLRMYSPIYDLLGEQRKVAITAEESVAIDQCRINQLTEVQLEAETYQALRYKSDQFGLNLVAVLELSTLFGDVAQFRGRTILICALLVLGILVVSFLMARSFYRPVGELLSNIDDDTDDDEDQSISEYTRIGRHLDNMHQERDELHEKLAMQRPMVRDQLLLRVIRGSLNKQDMMQMDYALPEIPRTEQPMYVLLLTADVASLKKAHMLEEISLEGANAHGVYVEEDRLFMMLVVCNTERKMRAEHSEKVMGLLQQMEMRTPGVSAGSVVYNLQSVPRSYLEAYIALKHHTESNNGLGVYLYVPEQMSTEMQENWLLQGGDDVGLYLQAVRSVDSQTALDVLHTLLKRLRCTLVSVLNASYMRFDLFSRTMAMCEPEVVEAFKQECKSISLFAGEVPFEDIMERLTMSNCQAVENRRNTGQSKQQQMILNTLREHCYDLDFSLIRLSELVGYSATFINRCLRMETGCSFMQLVSSYRMARVKQELAQTDNMIKDIIAQAGYVDIASFTRKFRTAEGITPSEYRAMNRSSGSVN